MSDDRSSPRTRKPRPAGGSARAAQSRNGRREAEIVGAAELLDVLTAVKRVDFSARLPRDRVGLRGRVADTLNDIIRMNQDLVTEIHRVSQVVGKEGRISQRASLLGAGAPGPRR